MIKYKYTPETPLTDAFIKDAETLLHHTPSDMARIANMQHNVIRDLTIKVKVQRNFYRLIKESYSDSAFGGPSLDENIKLLLEQFKGGLGEREKDEKPAKTTD